MIKLSKMSYCPLYFNVFLVGVLDETKDKKNIRKNK